MSHSFTKIWIHGIFGTKNRMSLIKSEFEVSLYNYIKNEMDNELGCKVKEINGTENHIHILFSLNPSISIKDIFKTIKGGSSYWVNNQNFIEQKFSWQIGYGAFSVSESKLDDVAKYIRNQKEHHKTNSFLEEYELFIEKYGLKNIKR